MARRITIKDHFRETRLFTNRVIAALLFIVLLIGIVMARLVQLQVLSHEHFTTLSINNRVRIQPLAPTRGLIFDRNGNVLAENQPSFSLEVIPERVENMEETLQQLAGIIDIREEDLKRFRRLLKQKRRFEGVPLRFRLDENEVAKFAINRHRFEGVDIEARPIRYYPEGELLVHAIGYVGRIDEKELKRVDASNYSGTTHIGKVGVERSYEDILHGTVGFQQVETNAQGRPLRILNQTTPIAGQNLYLSLDLELQKATHQALEGQRGAVVAIDPNNGEVLTLVSTPGYDPNLFVNGIDPDTYRELRTSRDKPLFNRALQGRYPPGSTLKPIIGLAGLSYRRIHPGSSLFCPGWYTLKGEEHRYRDWKKEGHGHVNLEESIVESCDVFFYDLAYDLGIDRLHAFLSRFGFGRKTGIDLIGENSGLLPSREWKRAVRHEPWYPGETLIAGIGQGFTVTTPLQLAYATSIIASKGQRHQPHIVQKLVDPISEDEHPKELEPLPKLKIRNELHWDAIHRAMIRVVHSARGTARRIGLNSRYQIAGKTGTAQVFGIAQDEEYEVEKVKKHLRDHSLFIAFAPAVKPQIALAVIVENAGSGSAVAAPIARKIMDHYLQDKL